MAVLVSPGVLSQEIDISLYASALTSTTLGLVGTCTQGLTDTPQLVTDTTQLANLFGNTNPLHPMIQVAQWYLKYGQALWVVRVANAALLASASAALTASSSAGVLQGSNTGPFTLIAPTSGTATGSVIGPYDIIVATNDQLAIGVDGGSVQDITLTPGATRTAQQICNDINGTITGAVASVSANGTVVITSNTTGVTSEINIEVPSSHSANATIGLTVATNFGIAGTNKLIVSIDGGSNQTITLPAGSQPSNQVAAAINSVLVGALASVVNGGIAITSSTSGSASSVQGVTSTSLTVLGFDTTLHSGANASGTSEMQRYT